MEAQSADVTLLLQQVANGNQEAAARLIPVVYGEFHRLAQRHFRLERPTTPYSPRRWCMRRFSNLSSSGTTRLCRGSSLASLSKDSSRQ